MLNYLEKYALRIASSRKPYACSLLQKALWLHRGGLPQVRREINFESAMGLLSFLALMVVLGRASVHWSTTLAAMVLICVCGYEALVRSSASFITQKQVYKLAKWMEEMPPLVQAASCWWQLGEKPRQRDYLRLFWSNAILRLVSYVRLASPSGVSINSKFFAPAKSSHSNHSPRTAIFAKSGRRSALFKSVQAYTSIAPPLPAHWPPEIKEKALAHLLKAAKSGPHKKGVLSFMVEVIASAAVSMCPPKSNLENYLARAQWDGLIGFIFVVLAPLNAVAFFLLSYSGLMWLFILWVLCVGVVFALLVLVNSALCSPLDCTLDTVNDKMSVCPLAKWVLSQRIQSESSLSQADLCAALAVSGFMESMEDELKEMEKEISITNALADLPSARLAQAERDAHTLSQNTACSQGTGSARRL